VIADANDTDASEGGLPSGTVTFVFTDLEGSTRLWEEHPEAMQAALARHDEILRDVIGAHGGAVVKTTGDGCLAAFATAPAAVAATVELQRALAAEAWPHTGPLRVRIGLHTGTAEIRAGDYFGTTLNRAARLMATAHGGQIVCSGLTAALVRDELPPGIELVDLGEHNLRDLARSERVFQIAVDGLDREFPPLRSLDAFPGNLPLQTTSFVGRDADLAAVADALDANRLVTLTGVGGVGKTRLSLQVAAELLPGFAHGARFCELAAATDADALTQVVASTLGVVPISGATLEHSIVEFLRAKSQLLVFDNCEHLLDEVCRLADAILRGCPDVRILASSREGMGLPGEQILAVRSLALPGADATLDAVTQSDAAALFAQRAAAARAGFTIDTTNAPAVAEICRRLDGIPLAIELAAARVGAMNPSDIAAHIDERFRLLTGGRRGGVERHQTLRATVDWSYSLLEPTEQVVFDRLGVFSGGLDASAAAAVATGDGIESWDVLDALGGLVAKSMITIDDLATGDARYHLLETLRAYALEQLAERGETDDWRRRHATHFTALVEEWGPELLGRDEIAIRRRLRTDVDNIRAALTWALDRDDPADRELGIRIVVGLASEVTLDRSGGYGIWAERALVGVEQWQPDQRSAIRSIASHAAMQRGDLVEALALAEASWAEWRLGSAGEFLSPVALGSARLGSGDIESALQVITEAATRFAAEAPGTYGYPNMLAVLATFLIYAGRLDEARGHAQESLRLSRPLGNPTELAISLAGLGAALVHDDPLAALSALEESIAITDAGASDVLLSHALANAAIANASLGRTHESLVLVRRSLGHSIFCGDLPGMIYALTNGLSVLTEFARPELLVAWTATIRLPGDWIGDAAQQILGRADARAAEALDPARAAEIHAEIATLTFDEAVDRILRAIDAEIVAS
jgi:predicted ATPase/class 3 adenylate cyclase